MRISTRSNRLPRLTKSALAIIAIVTAAGPASGTPCAFEPQGEGRVTAVTDARSFRLEDGRDVRLAGIEPAFSGKPAASHTQALTAQLWPYSSCVRDAMRVGTLAIN